MPRLSRKMHAFSLIELLVVIAILVIVAAITIPALSSARTSARVAKTKGMFNSLQAAAGQFSQDNQGRAPGYFSPKEMGGNSNMTGGFTTMGNMLLELTGGRVDVKKPGETIDVGPYGSGTAWAYFDENKFGTDAKYLPITADMWSKSAGAKQATGADNDKMPDLVDAFKNPILAWVEDDSFVGQPKTPADFAKEHSGSAGMPLPAKFYWAQNSGWLGSTSAGVSAIDQSTQSLLGSTIASKAESLAGALGHPSFPYRKPTDPAGTAPTVASKSRAPIMFHSAGPDGVFFGKNDQGAKQFPANNPIMKYEYNYQAQGGAKYYEKDGVTQTAIDITAKFDDVLSGTGN